MKYENQAFEIRYNSTTPQSVVYVEESLLKILNEHYYVQRQTFKEISAQDMAKHEICHLTKAIYKIQSFFDNSSNEALQIIKSEVIPDMIIYALECAVKYNINWWSPLIGKDDSPDANILSFLANKHFLSATSEYDLLNQVRAILIKSVSKLGHFCDKGDHYQNSFVNLEEEVILPFLRVSFYLSNYYKINLDELFSERLIFVENNYVGQPSFKKRLNKTNNMKLKV